MQFGRYSNMNNHVRPGRRIAQVWRTVYSRIRQALQYANVQWTHPALPARLPDVVARAQCKRERLPCYFYHARRGRCGKFLNLFSVTRRTVFSLLNNFGLFIPPGRLVALPGHLVTLSGADPGPEPPVNQAFRRFFEKTGQIDAV